MGNGCIDPCVKTSALVGDEWSDSSPDRFILGTHWIGGWVGPRTGLDYVKKRKKISPVTGLELRSLARPARNQSLYTALVRLIDYKIYIGDMDSVVAKFK
jgi:hypothetical protein